jgi:hypothetical protein
MITPLEEDSNNKDVLEVLMHNMRAEDMSLLQITIVCHLRVI